MEKSLSPHALHPKSVTAWKAICDICRVASTAVYSSNSRVADGQVHVESLVSLAEPEPDDSNDFLTYEKTVRI